MTDPDETANLVNDIIGAYCEHAAEMSDHHPVTSHDAAAVPLSDQIDRYGVLVDRNVMAQAIASLKARGTDEAAEGVSEAVFPPLTAAEHLEMLALGWSIARYYSHPSQLGHAVRAGASWAQIAAATGTAEDAARAAYRQWAEDQHKFAGMTDAAYAEALELAAQES